MPTHKRTIKWYDDNANDYIKHTRGKDYEGRYHFAFEKPAIYSHVPGLKGKKVLSLGCGPGEDAAKLKERGAVHSTGIDVSKGLIKLAKKNHPECEFFVMDMEKLKFDDKSFDFIFSSLALHYLPNWDEVMKQAFRVLKPGGTFLFSSSHPAVDAIEWASRGEVKKLMLGVESNRSVNQVKHHGAYLSEKEINISGDKFAVTFYHQSLGKIFKTILRTGFVVQGFWEPKPTKEFKTLDPQNYAIWSELPWLMIIKLQKPYEDN